MKYTSPKTFTFYTTGGTKFTVLAANRKEAKVKAYKATGEKITNRTYRVL